MWMVPAGRMKGGKEHRVPLSVRALELLRALPTEDGNDFVFIGSRTGTGLSNTTLAQMLKRMNRGDVTAHGFRSTFRDWAGETTNYPNFVVEMALAHAIGDKVEAAYRRGDLLAKRKAAGGSVVEILHIAATHRGGGADAQESVAVTLVFDIPKLQQWIEEIERQEPAETVAARREYEKRLTEAWKKSASDIKTGDRWSDAMVAAGTDVDIEPLANYLNDVAAERAPALASAAG